MKPSPQTATWWGFHYGKWSPHHTHNEALTTNSYVVRVSLRKMKPSPHTQWSPHHKQPRGEGFIKHNEALTTHTMKPSPQTATWW